MENNLLNTLTQLNWLVLKLDWNIEYIVAASLFYKSYTSNTNAAKDTCFESFVFCAHCTDKYVRKKEEEKEEKDKNTTIFTKSLGVINDYERLFI